MALATNLEGYWKLDESSGNAADATGLIGTLTNNNVTYSTGKLNNGAVFDSTTDNLTIASPSSINFAKTAPFSIAFWVNRSSITDNAFWVSKQNGNTNFVGYSVYGQSTGKVNFDFYDTLTNGLGVYTTTGFLTSTATWYHVVVTYDGSATPGGCHIYINASDKSLSTGVNTLSGTTTNTEDFQIGNRSNGTMNANATIDEVGIWSRVLTQAEATELYNSGSGNQYPFAPVYVAPINRRLTGASIRASNY